MNKFKLALSKEVLEDYSLILSSVELKTKVAENFPKYYGEAENLRLLTKQIPSLFLKIYERSSKKHHDLKVLEVECITNLASRILYFYEHPIQLQKFLDTYRRKRTFKESPSNQFKLKFKGASHGRNLL